jgi:hypothetical protein
MNDTTIKPPDAIGVVVVSEFPANRHGESVRVEIRHFSGRHIIDLRRYFTNPKTGQIVPSKKGMAIAIHKLPELAAAIDKACATAIDLGLIRKPEADK